MIRIPSWMLGRQRRTKIRVTLRYSLQRRSSQLRPVGTVRPPPTALVLHTFGSLALLARPHPLALPIAQPQQLRHFHPPQTACLHSSPYLYPIQFLTAQPGSSPSECLLSLALSMGTFLF